LWVGRVVSVELRIPSRVLIAVLIIDVVTILASETEGMFAVIPREVVQYLSNTVVDHERRAGIVTPAAQAASQGYGRNAPTLRHLRRKRKTQFLYYVSLAAQDIRHRIKHRGVPKTHLVHLSA